MAIKNLDGADWFRGICDKNKFHVSDYKLKLLNSYVQQLLEWNKKINLISRRDEENVWPKHILGSISFLFKFSIYEYAQVFDVGTGGGLPGIPIAILCPHAKVIMVDSIYKKIKAVGEMIYCLKLDNAQALCIRAEDLSTKEKYRNQFDYIIARAVAPAASIVKWCNHLLKGSNREYLAGRDIIPTGRILLLKGGNLEQEIEEIRIKYKPRLIETFTLTVDGIGAADLPDKKLLVIEP